MFAQTPLCMVYVHTLILYFTTLLAGTMTLLSNNPELIDAVKVAGDEPICRKDTGKGHKLRKWSRGHQFIVRGGGHIEMWAPLYK